MPTEACATFDDVNLILRLYELRRDEKMRQAREWFSKSFTAHSLDEFNSVCPPGSEQNVWFRMVVSYWEMVASFITGGVLNQELFFQSGHELLMVWEKIRDAVPQALTSGFQAAFWVGAGVALVGVIASLVLIRKDELAAAPAGEEESEAYAMAA